MKRLEIRKSEHSQVSFLHPMPLNATQMKNCAKEGDWFKQEFNEEQSFITSRKVSQVPD